jgi:lysyl-tRNA synthetase class 2
MPAIHQRYLINCLNMQNQNHIHITKKDRHGKVLTKLFDMLVEPKLIQPTFITGYPVEVSPLSRKSDTKPGVNRSI